MTQGPQKGIDVSGGAAAALAGHSAAGREPARALHRVLADGATLPSVGAGPRRDIAFTQTSDSRGLVLVALEARADGRIIAALVRPYDNATLADLRQRGVATDPRGAISSAGLDDWFRGDPEVVDVYNTEVEEVRDITAAFRTRLPYWYARFLQR